MWSMFDDIGVIGQLAVNAGGSLGGAFLAIKMALAHLDQKIDGNTGRLNEHGRRIDMQGNRITRVETRLNIVSGGTE